MAKMITRTIKVYTYTTGNVDFKSMKLIDVKNRAFPYKLTQREERKLEAENGAKIVNVSEGEALYAMSLEDFLTFAHPITSEESDIDVVE